MSSAESTVPYGYCQCGCGERTPIATDNQGRRVKGQPCEYVAGHQRRGPAAIRQAKVEQYRSEWAERGIEYGLCLCGCGEATSIWDESDFARGRIKGEPRRWISASHANRLSHLEYVEEDRGYQTPCWIWQRSLSTAGYGQLEGGLAHRAMYERLVGPIPDERDLDHLCRVPACVNPTHLEPVTHAVNMQRGANAKLDMATARRIRADFARWDGTPHSFCRKIAAEFDMKHQTIDALLRGQTWKED